VPGTSWMPTASFSARLATEVARILRGKHKPIFAHLMLTPGDHVVVINAAKVVFTGNADDKFAYRHSGYPGGLKSRSYTELLATQPEEVVRRRFRGMLPKNTLGRQQFGQVEGLCRSGSPPRRADPQPPRASIGPADGVSSSEGAR